MKLRTILLSALTLCTINVNAVVLKLATAAPDGNSWLKEMRAAGDRIKATSAGRVELKFYPGGVMGDATAVLRKIKLGQLHGGAFTGGELSVVNPDAAVYGLPFMFRSLEEVNAARVKLDPMVRLGFAAKGMLVPGISNGGFVYLFSSKPIASIEQVKATKVWVPAGDQASRLAFEAGAIAPVQLAIQDVYTSLQTGLIETIGNTPFGLIAFQWHTKVKHMADVPVSFAIGMMAIDKATVEKLSAEDQALVNKEIGVAFANLDLINAKDNGNARETLKKVGIVFDAPNADQLAAWRAMGAKAVQQMMTQGMLSKAALESVNLTVMQYRAMQPK
jgi:TRAP-type transport system periplasmic protein